MTAKVWEVAWAAGIFEGEGSLSFNGGRPRVQIRMTDEDVILRVQRILGGNVTGPYTWASKVGRKPIYVWAVTNMADVDRVLLMIRPYLLSRRAAAADAALANIRNSPARKSMTEREVIEARKRLERGETNASIARYFNVDPSCISKIKTGSRRGGSYLSV